MPSLPPSRITELYYGGQWNNISADMRESDAVTITRGVSAEGTRADPSAATALLDNRSGRYSPRNPNSPLYGEIGRNTPWRFSVAAGSPWAALPGGGTDRLATPDAAALDVTGDLDLSMELAAASWRKPQMLAARYASAAGNNRCWAFELAESGALIFMWSPDGTFAARRDVTSTLPVPAHNGQRMAVRVTLDVDNGAGGRTVRFYTARALNGPWVQLGADLTAAGTTSVLGGTAPLEVGRGIEFNQLPNGGFLYSLAGQVYGLRLRNGIGGPAVVDMDVARAPVGTTSWTDTTGRPWSVYGAVTITNRHTRMVGEVPAWPPARDLSGADRTVTIAPAGIMRRLGAGNRPLDSALRSYLIGANPLDCWPLTDGAQAQWGSSLLEFGQRMVPQDASAPLLRWGKGEIGDWVEPVVAIAAESTGSIRTTLPRAASAESGWAVDWYQAGDGVDIRMTISDWGAGTETQPRNEWLILSASGGTTIGLYRISRAGEESSVQLVAILDPVRLYDGVPHGVRFATVASGSTISWQVLVDGVLVGSGTQSATGRPVQSIELAWDPTGGNTSTTDLSVGYMTYWGASGPTAAAVDRAYRGFSGEAAGVRMLRLSQEHGVPASVAGEETEQTRLGIQRPDRYLDTLGTISATDLGYLFERRDERELVYRARTTLYNQTPVLTLDFSAGVIAEPFRPTDDDKNTVNDVTVTRDGGASSSSVLASGRMSVLDPPAGVGRYDATYTLPLETDAQTGEHAQWRMYLGTVDSLRYTRITLNLANPRVHALIDGIYRVDVGDLIRLTNLPAEYGPDPVDLIVRGYTEEIGADRWTITLNCGPGAPWQVGVVDDPVLARADTDGSQLAAAVTSSAAALPITVTAGPDWITTATYPAEFPFDVALGGEVATCTAITGVAEDTFGRTSTAGWGTADSGQPWAVEGGTAADYSVSSGTGRHRIATTNVFRITSLPVVTANIDLRVDIALDQVPVGDSAYLYACIRRQDDTHMYFARVQVAAGGAMFLNLRKRNGSETLLGTAYTTPYTYAAGAWYTIRVAMIGSTIMGKVWPRTAAEPGWQATATDTDLTAAGAVALRTLLGSAATNTLPVTALWDGLYAGPQQMTVTRSVNGISKAHSVGTDVRLAHPSIVAL